MRRLLFLLALVGAPAAAQIAPPPAAPPPIAAATPVVAAPAVWNPAADYITPGQDLAGYHTWLAGHPLRPILVASFDNYLRRYQVGGVVPTWQLLRTATSWHRCGAQPFEVPPPSEWSHLVQTLRYVEAHVIPVIGPVEAVSAYRNPLLNSCAGGAPESAHRHFSAVDLVPLRPIDRDGLIRSLCAIHAWRGPGYQVGLGFYAFHRFHVDTTKFRKWGVDATPEASPCTSVLASLHIAEVTAKVAAEQQAAAAAAAASPSPAPVATPVTTSEPAPAEPAVATAPSPADTSPQH